MDAWKTWHFVVQGEYTSQVTILCRVRSAIRELNDVLSIFGDKYKPRIREVKDKLKFLQKRALKKLREDAETVVHEETVLAYDDSHPV